MGWKVEAFREGDDTGELPQGEGSSASWMVEL